MTLALRIIVNSISIVVINERYDLDVDNDYFVSLLLISPLLFFSPRIYTFSYCSSPSCDCHLPFSLSPVPFSRPLPRFFFFKIYFFSYKEAPRVTVSWRRSVRNEKIKLGKKKIKTIIATHISNGKLETSFLR